MSLPQLLVSMLLFVVLFFGIGFLLNMLLRMTWVMAVIYPVVVILIVDNIRFIEYFQNTSTAFTTLRNNILALGTADILILASGIFGAVLSGVIIKMLRVRGYQMF
ncbi:YuiB family protein [Bacillus tianshenii]|nr:YuiB family protein [Bacillus tianshenii]